MVQFFRPQKKKKKIASSRDILLSQDWLVRREKSAKYVTKEYQEFGLMLASKLDDQDRISMYIKFAKNEDRAILLKALSFTDDYPKARNKAKIFLWKLKELRQERKEKEKKEGEKQLSII